MNRQTQLLAAGTSHLRFAARMIVLGMALGTPVLAQAALRCIENESEVHAKLNAALASAEQFEDVRIKSGVYTFSNGQIGYYGVLEGNNKTLSIRGGWSGAIGSCTTQDGNSTATVFDGDGQRPIFHIDASSTFTGSIKIENMLFYGGFANISSLSSSALTLKELNGVMSIVVDRVWIENNITEAGGISFAIVLDTSSGLVFRNSLVVNNNTGMASAVRIAVGGGTSNLVLNNTIARNTSAHASGWVGLVASPSNGATLLLANNLMDGNVATAGPRIDIRTDAGTTFTNNRYTGLFGTPTAESGSSTGSAGFNGNAFDLAVGSTARDAGAFFVPLLQGTLDALTGARVQGSAVDLGALEFPTVFDDGFESN